MLKYRSAMAILAGCACAASADLTNTANYFGNYGAQIDAVAFPGVTDASGTFAVSGLPGGATVVSAFFHSNDWFNNGVMQHLTFNGTNAGPKVASTWTSDGLFDYRWDVTSLVTGNGSYDFVLSGGEQIYMGALTVIYQDASLPTGSVHVYEGAETIGQSGNETLNIELTGAAPGPAFFQIVSQADDAFTSGEEIFYNGDLIGGPFDANLGDYASLISAPVVNNGVAEQIQINTYGDYFGLHVGLVTTTIPAPGALAVLACSGAFAARRRR